MDVGASRPLNTAERALIERLLEAEFPGRDQLRLQLKSTTVLQTGEDGSLLLSCGEGPPAPVEYALPVEGYVYDSDGVQIWVMLFVGDGFLEKLDIVKVDCSQIVDPPTAASLVVPR